jgi:DUF971 family protein
VESQVTLSWAFSLASMVVGRAAMDEVHWSQAALALDCQPAAQHYPIRMRPLDIQQIGEEVAIKWEDGSESYIRLETLRRQCPCAECRGETDVMGNLYKGPEVQLSPAAFQLREIRTIGGYAVQPVWGDGHSSGIYSFDYLKRVAEATATN